MILPTRPSERLCATTMLSYGSSKAIAGAAQGSFPLAFSQRLWKTRHSSWCYLYVGKKNECRSPDLGSLSQEAGSSKAEPLCQEHRSSGKKLQFEAPEWSWFTYFLRTVSLLWEKAEPFLGKVEVCGQFLFLVKEIFRKSVCVCLYVRP